MIVIDASAVLAIYLAEPERDGFVFALASAPRRMISPVNFWEVVARAKSINGKSGVDEVLALLTTLGVEIEPIDAAMTHLAIEALQKYGRRPAKLNLGDCFAYALAKSLNAPLLFKGDDFAATDIVAA